MLNRFFYRSGVCLLVAAVGVVGFTGCAGEGDPLLPQEPKSQAPALPPAQEGVEHHVAQVQGEGEETRDVDEPHAPVQRRIRLRTARCRLSSTWMIELFILRIRGLAESSIAISWVCTRTTKSF